MKTRKNRINTACLLIIFLLTFSNKSFADTDPIPLDSIQRALNTFMKETEHWPWEVDSMFCTMVIDSKKNQDLLQCREGVFLIIVLSSNGYSHFLLLDEDSLQIVNMRNPLDENLNIMLKFFSKNNQYSKEDTVFHIEELLRIYRLNKKKVEDHKRR